MSAEQREFDIVLYGATGFVGKLTAEYLARAGGAARIGLAGRSAERLLAVRESLGDAARDWPLIVADAGLGRDRDDLRRHDVGELHQVECTGGRVVMRAAGSAPRGGA